MFLMLYVFNCCMFLMSYVVKERFPFFRRVTETFFSFSCLFPWRRKNRERLGISFLVLQSQQAAKINLKLTL